MAAAATSAQKKPADKDAGAETKTDARPPSGTPVRTAGTEAKATGATKDISLRTAHRNEEATNEK